MLATAGGSTQFLQSASRQAMELVVRSRCWSTHCRRLQKEIWCAEERGTTKPTASMPDNLQVTRYQRWWRIISIVQAQLNIGLTSFGPLQKSACTMLNKLIDRAVHKIFEVTDKDDICCIRQSVGLHNVDVLYRLRRAKFLLKAKRLNYSLLQAPCIDIFN